MAENNDMAMMALVAMVAVVAIVAVIMTVSMSKTTVMPAATSIAIPNSIASEDVSNMGGLASGESEFHTVHVCTCGDKRTLVLDETPCPKCDVTRQQKIETQD